MFASASKHAASAIPTPRPWRESCQSSGRGCPATKAVGRIDVIGEGVEGWKLDQRVGVGFLGGNCGYCDYCRDGDLVNCTNQGYTGVQHDGGYAEMMIAKASGLIAVPDDLSSVDAAPLLCAGLT